MCTNHFCVTKTTFGQELLAKPALPYRFEMVSGSGTHLKGKLSAGNLSLSQVVGDRKEQICIGRMRRKRLLAARNIFDIVPRGKAPRAKKNLKAIAAFNLVLWQC